MTAGINKSPGIAASYRCKPVANVCAIKIYINTYSKSFKSA